MLLQFLKSFVALLVPGMYLHNTLKKGRHLFVDLNTNLFRVATLPAML